MEGKRTKKRKLNYKRIALLIIVIIGIIELIYGRMSII